MTTDVKKFVSTKMYQIGRDAIDYGVQLTIDDAEYLERRKELVERSFMQSSKELNDAILKDFQKNQRKTWDEVISRVDTLDDDAKAIFAPNIGATKEVITTVLKGDDLDNDGLLRKITTGSEKYSFAATNVDFLKGIYADVEKFEAKNKGKREDRINAFGAVAGGVSARAAQVGRPDIATAAAVAGAAVVGTHYVTKVIANDRADRVIQKNHAHNAQQKKLQKKIKRERPSNLAKQYINRGLTR